MKAGCFDGFKAQRRRDRGRRLAGMVFPDPGGPAVVYFDSLWQERAAVSSYKFRLPVRRTQPACRIERMIR